MSPEDGRWACDTSVAIAALDPTTRRTRPAARRCCSSALPWPGTPPVYDALVGRAASVDQRVLLTRDRRAERTYRALDVRHHMVG